MPQGNVLSSIFSKGQEPSPYISRVLDLSFEDVVSRTASTLEHAGFDIASNYDVQKSIRLKNGEEIRKYNVISASDPLYTYTALQTEDKIGALLPCTIIIQEMLDGKVEVAAMDPNCCAGAARNPALDHILKIVASKLRVILDTL